MNMTMNGSKYDYSMERTYNFYDSLPYERNLLVCGNDSIGMFSGNVVKFATYQVEDTKEIPNQDDVLFARLKQQA